MMSAESGPKQYGGRGSTGIETLLAMLVLSGCLLAGLRATADSVAIVADLQFRGVAVNIYKDALEPSLYAPGNNPSWNAEEQTRLQLRAGTELPGGSVEGIPGSRPSVLWTNGAGTTAGLPENSITR